MRERSSSPPDPISPVFRAVDTTDSGTGDEAFNVTFEAACKANRIELRQVAQLGGDVRNFAAGPEIADLSPSQPDAAQLAQRLGGGFAIEALAGGPVVRLAAGTYLSMWDALRQRDKLQKVGDQVRMLERIRSQTMEELPQLVEFPGGDQWLTTSQIKNARTTVLTLKDLLDGRSDTSDHLALDEPYALMHSFDLDEIHLAVVVVPVESDRIAKDHRVFLIDGTTEGFQKFLHGYRSETQLLRPPPPDGDGEQIAIQGSYEISKAKVERSRSYFAVRPPAIPASSDNAMDWLISVMRSQATRSAEADGAQAPGA